MSLPIDKNNNDPEALLSKRVAIEDAMSDKGYLFPDREAELEDGTLVVGPTEVMHSAAGYYLGQYCFEWKSDGELWFGEWCGPMPYARDTGYMSKDDATSLLELEQAMTAENFGPPAGPRVPVEEESRDA